MKTTKTTTAKFKPGDRVRIGSGKTVYTVRTPPGANGAAIAARGGVYVSATRCEHFSRLVLVEKGAQS